MVGTQDLGRVGRHGAMPLLFVVAGIFGCGKGAQVNQDLGPDGSACFGVTLCTHGDDCCPNGCHEQNDDDCSSTCGNGVIEGPGETCDGNCPATCDDGNSCTNELSTGAAATCDFVCANIPIAICQEGDGCCAPGCTFATDSNCSETCGNGTVEPPEICDANCVTTCNDAIACTVDLMTGTPEQCNVQCSHTAITFCQAGDGCCPQGCNRNSDPDCSAVCGNGVVEGSETCDGNCASSCADANACTTDGMTGSWQTCDLVCTHVPITTCVDGDGCCAPGCNASSDDDCDPNCGNGAIESGETCDGSCPTSCGDGNSCTTDVLTGMPQLCNVVCTNTPIMSCTNGDGCCAPGCNNGNDNDCSATCGNGTVEAPETCDGNCASVCDDMNECTMDTRTGSAAQCNVQCSHAAVTGCADGDGCCPQGCNANGDDDCSPVCGNGAVEPGETCDGSCPTGCNDSNACTSDVLMGSSGSCNAQCVHSPVTTCTNGDGCCPAACNANNDNDCTPACGNGAVEMGETCDGNCPAACEDMNACTTDSRIGSAAQCNVQCLHTQVTACMGGDGCCPPTCNANNDANCSAMCGNGSIEAPEICDGNCPATCDDGMACTSNVRNGSAAQCNVTCTYPAITACANGDGCCAPGCNQTNDDTCTPMCGNGVVESGETCDGSCPTTCPDDGNTCTSEVLTGSAATCDRQCTHPAITSCTGGDGCCPSGCNNGNDNDCAPPFCTLIYDLTPQYWVNGSPEVNTTRTLPDGTLALRVGANSSGAPLAGSSAEMLFFWADTEFSQDNLTYSCFLILCGCIGVDFTTNLNAFATTCNGTASPSTSSPPDPCNYSDASTTGALGTFTGTQVTWGACTRHANYGGGSYVPSDASSASTGPGCIKNFRVAGNINCSGNSGCCDDGYGLNGGANTIDTTFNQPLEPLMFSNGVQNVSMAWVSIPNNLPGTTSIQFTGVRVGGTCN